MIYPAARGGILTVVESYRTSGIAGSDTTYIPTYVDGGFARRQWMFAKALARSLGAFATGKVSLAHIHSAAKGSFWRKAFLARLASWFKVPVVFHLHGSEMQVFYDRQKSWVQRIIGRVFARADRVVVLSDSWYRFVKTISPDARITVIPNYVDIPDTVEHPSEPVELLFLGLIGPRKGTFDLLHAFARARASVPGIRLTIGGNGDTQGAARLIDELGIGNAVELAGWVGAEQRSRLLARASIYVLPSYNEGLPMSVLEAMSNGLATITTRVGGLPEAITDGVDGVLIEAGDIDALTAAILRLSQDTQERLRIGDAGRQRVIGHYSAAVALPRLQAVYEEVSGRQAGL